MTNESIKSDIIKHLSYFRKMVKEIPMLDNYIIYNEWEILKWYQF